MKIFIATPMYGGMCTGQYTNSLLELVGTLQNAGYSVMYGKTYNESLITRARNTLVQEFLNSDCTHLLFIDADHGFKSNEILKMVRSDVGVIGAIYPMKSINWPRVYSAIQSGIPIEELEKYTGYFSANLKSDENQSVTIVLDKPLQVDNVATGMMLIKREVFERMIPTTGTYAGAGASGHIEFGNNHYEFFKTEVDDNGVLLSEDYYFCKKWEELGEKVYAAPWVQITHFGSYEFSGSFAKSIILQSKLESAQFENNPKAVAKKKSKK